LPSGAGLIVISGPSGAGKGTLIQNLLNNHPDKFATTVSHTTRSPRVGEVDGVAYFFVSPSTFGSLISQDAFVEHTSFGGHHYGTSYQTIADQRAKRRMVVLDIEMQGVMQMKQMKADPDFDPRYVFIKTPSFEVLETRLRKRGTETEESIQRRLAQAKVELEYAETPGVHDKIIVNDNKQKAYRELEEFIFRS
jgi:guanylate kinase